CTPSYQLLCIVTYRLQLHCIGQKIGTKIINKMNRISVRGNPTFKKSLNLYFPGPNTKMQDGSKGAINDTDAPNITAMAKVRGWASKIWAVCSATGKITKAAAALLMGWVRRITKITKPAST